MKKILLSLALILSVTMMSAQSPAAVNAKKAIDKAAEAAADAKKASKAATWIALADSYLKAYDVPAGNLLQGVGKQEVATLLKGQKPVSVETLSTNGGELEVEVYSDKKLYYNGPQLDAWIITNPVDADLLAKATEALLKAAELGAKPADVQKRFEDIHSKYYAEALNYYTINDFATASAAFENTANSYDNNVVNKIDSLSLYNAAFVAGMAKDNNRAIEIYKLCASKGVYEDGNVFSNLADIYKGMGDTDACKKTLEDGFITYPANQGILIGLINLYMETNDDPQKIFDLLHSAESNEPNNASLYKAEGDVYKNLKEYDKAVELYHKSFEINPEYVFGILSEGIMYYDLAVEIQDKAAAELDDAKYMALNKEFEEVLTKAIEPLEKSFAASNDNDVKGAIAEYLKNIYFRFRDKDDNQAKYEQYKSFLGE